MPGATSASIGAQLGTPPQRLGLIIGKPERHRHVTDTTVRFTAPRCERASRIAYSE
jgi:hypothetical protein